MIRQKLASVELGSPSLPLSRMKGFSPVRIVRLGSATLIQSSRSGTGSPVRRCSHCTEFSRRPFMVVVRRALVILVAGTLGYSGATWGQALSSNEPSGRVGRLAFTQGTVSYHDSQRTDWEPATINRPLSTGDAVWTEPGAHFVFSFGGPRVRKEIARRQRQMWIEDRAPPPNEPSGRVDIK